MYLASMYLSMALLIAAMIGGLVLVISKKTLLDREKASPFECGFAPAKKARAPFSLRFFLTTIIFLIFDIELALLLPLGLALPLSNIIPFLWSILALTMIITWGLIHEWTYGALNWTP